MSGKLRQNPVRQKGFVFLGLLLGIAIHIQASIPGDSTQSPVRKMGLSLIFDTRNSFIRDQPITIYGLNIGVKYKERFRFGIGGYFAEGNYSGTRLNSTNPNLANKLNSHLRLKFITPNFAYTFHNSRWVELSVPMEIGFGSSHYTLSTVKEVVIKEKAGTFVPAGLGFNALFKVTRWVGVSGLVGYRKSLFEEEIKGDFDGWFYSGRINIFLGTIVSDWRHHREQRSADSNQR